MPGIILQGTALKVVNKGGGFPTKTVVDITKDELGAEHRSHRHLQSRNRIKGSDYVIFMCPGCGKRNKQSVYQMKGRAGQSLSFKCNKCCREIELTPPRKINLFGADGKPINA